MLEWLKKDWFVPSNALVSSFQLWIIYIPVECVKLRNLCICPNEKKTIFFAFCMLECFNTNLHSLTFDQLLVSKCTSMKTILIFLNSPRRLAFFFRLSKTTCWSKRFLRFHGHVTHCLIWSPLANKLKIDFALEYFGKLRKEFGNLLQRLASLQLRCPYNIAQLFSFA